MLAGLRERAWGMDDGEKQFYSDPAFELDLNLMRLKAHMEFANEKLLELKAVADKIAEQQKRGGDDS